MKKLSLLFPLLLFAVWMTGCKDTEAQKQAAIRTQLLSDTVVPVTIISPRIQTVQQTLDINGQLEASQEVVLSSKVTGKLSNVTVQDGSPVRADQIIAQIDATDLYEQVRQAEAAVAAAQAAKKQAEMNLKIVIEQTSAIIAESESKLKAAKARLDMLRKGAREQEKRQAQERVKGAKAKLDKAKADVERARKLFNQDAISKSELDAMESAYESAQAEYQTALEAYDLILEGTRTEELQQAEEAVRQAEEQLRSAKASANQRTVHKQNVSQTQAKLEEAQAMLRLAKTRYKDATITSPIDGYVSGRPAQAGTVVSPGVRIATIVSIRGTYFEGQIPETEVRQVRIGQRVIVHVDALPNEEFRGIVEAIRPDADSLGRTFRARVVISDSDNRLRPGMFARAKLVLRDIPEALTIPMDAVLIEEGKSYVFIVRENKAKRIEITLGARKDNWVQVSNISPSDKVIVEGKTQLADGTSIRVETNRSGGKHNVVGLK